MEKYKRISGYLCEKCQGTGKIGKHDCPYCDEGVFIEISEVKDDRLAV